jgi:integrase
MPGSQRTAKTRSGNDPASGAFTPQAAVIVSATVSTTRWRRSQPQLTRKLKITSVRLSCGSRAILVAALCRRSLLCRHRHKHDVRHTYATVSLDSGINPKIVADRIGHSNMAYTLQIYTHPSTGRDRNAADIVAEVLLGAGWTCDRCGAAYFGTQPEDGLCEACAMT